MLKDNGVLKMRKRRKKRRKKTRHPLTSSYTFRDALKGLHSHHKFQIVIVFMVIIDVLFVLIEVLLDLEPLVDKVDHVIPEVLFCL
ncbi:voltage-gated hydrogen channel 1-like [Mixophyes fleayi]|uniref:voltage-gated hydrogen channel 1-like n=1 Tax=Mixophyes fleayi TaxID=3061075 RepID=UPI003F4DFEDC